MSIYSERQIKTKCIVAKNPVTDNIFGLKVFKFDGGNYSEIDAIVISNYQFIEPIKRDLEIAGFEGQIIGLDEIYKPISLACI